MTEPSPEAIEIADNQLLAEVLLRGLAREIDALTEQRVAAAVERIREKTPDRAGILVNAIISEAADRPAPEGAAPLTAAETLKLAAQAWSLARPRRSTPAVWTEEDIRASRAKADECDMQPSPPKDAGGLGSASNTDAAQERHLTPGEQSVMKRALRNSTTESSPTQTVAAAEHDAKAFAAAEREISRLTHENADLRAAMRTAAVAPPGPTAGDVERARSIIDDAANIVGGPEAGMLCKGIAVALAAERASARAELLAQIRDILADGSKEKDAMSPYRTLQRIQDLADKLTEAK